LNRLLTIFAVVVIFVVVLYFSVSLRPLLQRLYPLDYSDIISEQARLYKIDPLLIAAIISVESRWVTTAVSSKGAAGLMQLMPDTAVWIAAQTRTDFTEDDIFIPEINIRFGCWYLNYLQEQFSSLTAALAAYNGGQGNVRQWLAENIWDGSYENFSDIPFWETRGYIKKITYTWNIYQKIYDYQWEE